MQVTTCYGISYHYKPIDVFLCVVIPRSLRSLEAKCKQYLSAAKVYKIAQEIKIYLCFHNFTPSFLSCLLCLFYISVNVLILFTKKTAFRSGLPLLSCHCNFCCFCCKIQRGRILFGGKASLVFALLRSTRMKKTLNSTPHR